MVTVDVRAARAAAATWTRRPPHLTVVGAAAMTLVVADLAALALLPTGASPLAKTVSVDVYGPYGELVPLALLLFGFGALALGRAIALCLRGRAGRLCGGLVAVWATVSLIDAVVPTNRSGRHTVHGEVHIGLAITGLVAQVVVAVAYPLVLRRREIGSSYAVLGTGVLVLAAGSFFAVHPAGLAGMAERCLFLTSAAWMVVGAVVARRGRPAGGESAGVGSRCCRAANHRHSLGAVRVNQAVGLPGRGTSAAFPVTGVRPPPRRGDGGRVRLGSAMTRDGPAGVISANRPPPGHRTPAHTHEESGMTSHVGRPTRSEKPRVQITSAELLTAVSELGPTWPARFGDHEIVDVNEAVDRELLAGNLVDAVTLSPKGRQQVLRHRTGNGGE